MAKARNSFIDPHKVTKAYPQQFIPTYPQKSLSLIQCEGKLQEKECDFASMINFVLVKIRLSA